ncbi:signal transduction histidine kinase [Haloactinospora alba]|uniref:histidine kinase n=1 Tax=Haloactinospora alba TaxID=405555 RepID=A0A543NNH2_9ACTN|nr:ATP-binding protein [Haloactinospora alba]TQN33384.1 signal transduction histidine kinase [Haloactinospora alba]
MSDPPSSSNAEHRHAHGTDASSPPPEAHEPSGVRTLHLWIAVLPAAAVTVLSVATVTVLFFPLTSPTMTRGVLAVAAAGITLILACALYGAESATNRINQRVDALRSLNHNGRDDVQRMVNRVRAGERGTPAQAASHPAANSDPFALLAAELQQGYCSAQQAVNDVADLKPAQDSDQQVEVFVNVARRMQSLVHREISLLDELESQVEDPELLKGLFTIDHLATRMRRQSESLAVLGGSSSRRRWSEPIHLFEVLRSAVAEVEHYSRVKVVPSTAGTLDGASVVDIIHLVAELTENATKFSPPHAQVLLRAEEVAAGVAVEVEDRGLGIPADEQHQINELLSDPGQINVSELLRDGRIGLFVVATLARKHNVRVQLRTNVYGGTQAIAVLPNELVNPALRESQQQAEAQPAAPEPDPAPPSAPVMSPAPTQGTVPSPPPAPAAVGAGQTGPGPAPAGAGTGPAGAGTGQTPTAHRRAPAENGHGNPGGGPTAAEQSTRPSGQGMPDGPTSTQNSDLRPTRSTDEAGRHQQGGQRERPPLPQRRVQGHMAPQLRDGPATGNDEQTADHSPGLMASFQSGFKRAEEETEDSSLGRTDSTP